MTGIAAHQSTVADRIATFRAKVEPLGATVDHVPGSPEAAAVIATLAQELATSTALVSAELASAAPTLLAALTAAGLETPVPPDVAALDAPLGLSFARRAVAETGSVLLAEPTLQDRSTALVTQVNLTLCRTADLLDSLDDTVPDLRAVATQPGGGYATFVTGPSRTADIEMSLTVGVQGPRRIAILFLDDLT